MNAAPIAAWKMLSWAVGIVAAVVFAMDPTWKMLIVGALIASIAPTITGLFALRLQAKNAVTLDRVEKNTNGINAHLMAANQSQGAELKEANRKADTAQGRQDERDAQEK